MPKEVTREEIQTALKDYAAAQAALDNADPNYTTAAVYRYTAALAHVDALYREAKVIPFLEAQTGFRWSDLTRQDWKTMILWVAGILTAAWALFTLFVILFG